MYKLTCITGLTECLSVSFRYGELDYWNEEAPAATTPAPSAAPRQGPGVPKPILPRQPPAWFSFLYQICLIVLWMYRVYYRSALYEENILKHCDDNGLTVTCCQHLFTVDWGDMVVDEAGGRVNIFGENVFILDSCLLLIWYTCTYDTLKINKSFIFYTAVCI